MAKVLSLIDAHSHHSTLRERIAEHLELAHCCAVEVRAEADECTVLHDQHAPGTPNLAGDHRLSDFHSAEERRALGAGETMIVGDVRLNERDATVFSGPVQIKRLR